MKLSVHVPKESRPRLTDNRIPVTWDGFQIGTGLVSSDGATVVIVLDDTTVSREIQEKISSTQTAGLSINPRTTQ